jgi:hypothetical protein
MTKEKGVLILGSPPTCSVQFVNENFLGETICCVITGMFTEEEAEEEEEEKKVEREEEEKAVEEVEEKAGDFQLIKLKGFCLVIYPSFEGHVRHFFVQDADGLENRLLRVSDVQIISHEIPAYVKPSDDPEKAKVIQIIIKII